MITISDSARAKITELLNEEGNPNLKLRTFVHGGGCSGFQYGFTFDEDQAEDDWAFELGPYKILVDSMSMTYLENAEIDYKDDISGSQFTIKNPNATTTCGCGSSFSI